MATSIATQAMLMPLERATVPALRSAPAPVVLIPVLVGAGVQVGLLIALAATLAGAAKLLAPGSELADFRTATSVAALSHAPLLLWTGLSFVLTVQIAHAAAGASVVQDLLSATPIADRNFALLAVWRPWAWWGSAAVLVGLAALVDVDKRRGLRIGALVVGLFMFLELLIRLLLRP